MQCKIKYNKKADMSYVMIAMASVVIIMIVFIVMRSIIQNVFAP